MPVSLRQRARRVARAAAFAPLSMSQYAALRVHQRLQPERAQQLFERYRERWIDSLYTLFGVTLDLAAPGVPPPSGHPRLVVSNHRSAYDIGVLLKYFGGVMVSRGDLASWPVLGPLARFAGTIFVDRDEGKAGQRAGAVRVLRRALQAGTCVSLFPEGTTFEGDTVREFHAGAFVAARGLGVEVVPVGIAYPPGAEFRDIQDFPAHLAESAERARTTISIVIGEPERLTLPPREAAEHYRARVQALVHRARARLVE